MKPRWYGLKNAWNWGNTRNCAGNLVSVVCVCVCVSARARWLRKRAKMRGNGQFGVKLRRGREGWSIWTKTHYFVHENHVLYFQINKMMVTKVNSVNLKVIQCTTKTEVVNLVGNILSKRFYHVLVFVSIKVRTLRSSKRRNFKS